MQGGCVGTQHNFGQRFRARLLLWIKISIHWLLLYLFSIHLRDSQFLTPHWAIPTSFASDGSHQIPLSDLVASAQIFLPRISQSSLGADLSVCSQSLHIHKVDRHVHLARPTFLDHWSRCLLAFISHIPSWSSGYPNATVAHSFGGFLLERAFGDLLQPCPDAPPFWGSVATLSPKAAASLAMVKKKEMGGGSPKTTPCPPSDLAARLSLRLPGFEEISAPARRYSAEDRILPGLTQLFPCTL